MKKVICINAKVLRFNKADHIGLGLVEGKEYTALGEVRSGSNGNPCYVIAEFSSARLKMRFVDAEEYKAKEETTEDFGEKIVRELEKQENLN